MAKLKGKVVSVRVTPYHILDIMADPAYMPFFVRRYHIAMEIAIAKGKLRPYWSYVYENNIKLLYDDCIDEIKRILGMQKSSGATCRFHGKIKDIVLDAAEDWVVEKEGRTPAFEIFPNTVKSARINMKHYGPYLAEQERKRKAAEAAAASTTIDLGHPGTPSVREEPDRGNECDDLL